MEELHPFLAHYMDAACNPNGTTGAWNAITGNTGGWRLVDVDLSAYAGQAVELYISYAFRLGDPGLGVFVDDISLAGYPLEDFEAGSGAWSASVAPGSFAFNNWERIPGASIPEGPAIRASNSAYLGFGFEGIANAADRSFLMQRVLDYLIAP